MKVEELRWNNLVKVKGTDKFIQFRFPIHNDLSEQLNLMLNEIEPIPLSEEWLIRFGFEKNKCELFNNWVIPTYGKYEDYHSVQIEKATGEFIYSISNSDAGCYVLSADIKYCHQLQNLYFALTGKELELN